MKSYIYMNHHIRTIHPKTPEPVITIQTGSYRIYCNELEICGKSKVKFGKLSAHGHDVTAWIETTSKVRVIK